MLRPFAIREPAENERDALSPTRAVFDSRAAGTLPGAPGASCETVRVRRPRAAPSARAAHSGIVLGRRRACDQHCLHLARILVLGKAKTSARSPR